MQDGFIIPFIIDFPTFKLTILSSPLDQYIYVCMGIIKRNVKIFVDFKEWKDFDVETLMLISDKRHTSDTALIFGGRWLRMALAAGLIKWPLPGVRMACMLRRRLGHSVHSTAITSANRSWSIGPLTHWGRVTHICVSTQTIIDSDNGLSPGRRQAIIWTSAGILLIGPLGANFNEIVIEIDTFHSRKCIW